AQCQTGWIEQKSVRRVQPYSREVGSCRTGSFRVGLSTAADTFARAISRGRAQLSERGGLTLNMTMMRKKTYIAGMAVLAAITLAGCAEVNEMLGTEESVDYKSTVRGEPLSIPPD